MKSNFRNKLLVAAVLATTAPLALVSTTALAQAHGTPEQRAKDKKDKVKEEREARAAARQDARTERQSSRDARPDVRQAARERQLQDIRERQAAQSANQAARQDARHDRQMGQIANQAARQENRAERQQAQIANQASRQEARADRQDARAARRLDRAQQQALITTQQSRVNSYRTWQRQQRTAAQQAAAALQAQKRAAQYAYIQDYNNRLWTQQQQYMGSSINYWNDPYFYTGPSYRYMRDGSWYTINNYGYQLLQQAINQGYGEGYRAGRADRMDGWRYDYRGSWAYQNASYGYSGYYLDRGDYSYYFRQGFRRGYEDGYYSRYRYGTYRGGNYSIIGAVLNTILSVQAYDGYGRY